VTRLSRKVTQHSFDVTRQLNRFTTQTWEVVEQGNEFSRLSDQPFQTSHTAEERRPQRKASTRYLPQIQGGPQIGSEGFPEPKKEIRGKLRISIRDVDEQAGAAGR